jgi:RimJ/RimL family protein N-acetyltransferase
MRFRWATNDDLPAITALLAATGTTIDTAKPRFPEFVDRKMYRPEWTRVADRSGAVVAAAVFWGPPEGDCPVSLDGLFGDASAWTPLLAGVPDIDYHVFLPGDWRDDPAVTAALEPRRRAAAGAGLTEMLERYRYEWTQSAPVPPPSARLEFRPEPDDVAWARMFADVAVGSLDHNTREEVARLGPAGYAEAEVELYRSFPSPREWWFFAYDRAGELVGFGMPSANHGGPVVGFLGVLPAHRGHGYVDEILAGITRWHAGRDAQRIVADTDSTNVPMARCFERSGYRRFGVRFVFSRSATK